MQKVSFHVPRFIFSTAQRTRAYFNKHGIIIEKGTKNEAFTVVTKVMIGMGAFTGGYLCATSQGESDARDYYGSGTHQSSILLAAFYGTLVGGVAGCVWPAAVPVITTYALGLRRYNQGRRKE